MNAEEWIVIFATAIEAEPPPPEEVEKMLELASEAAHNSERKAAPVACWIAGRAGVDLEEARDIAAGIGGGDG
jgi:hypothetical protein